MTPAAPTAPATAPAAARLHRLELGLKPGVADARGDRTLHAIRRHLGLDVAAVRTRDIYTFDADLSGEELARIAAEFTDPVIQLGGSPRLEADDPPGWDWMIIIGFKPGVTDNVGRTSRTAVAALLGRPLAEDEGVYTSTAWVLAAPALTRADAQRIADELLANPLIQSTQIISRAEWEAGAPRPGVPRVQSATRPRVEHIDLSGSDDDLLRISQSRTLALSLAEMRAIRDYFRQAGSDPRRRELGLNDQPTDVELEMLAQTWSEHCKHKIFAARIDYTDETGRTQTIDSLFKTYIRGATQKIGERIDWLVSVFHDNAGVIAFNDRIDLVYKVETHNSPSALEPYGGAMTGIVGVNRDTLGTGMGAEPLVNVWGYCFASPFTPPAAVPDGVMHPRRLRDGVHQGVIDGGNQSGIPYGLGWEFFDARYLAKPMVYCGTLGWLPKRIRDGRPAAEKVIQPGDLAVMVGGRIGKDGIHGATFSSEELHKDSPVQAVQIGDPITQKKMTDFLIEARDRGLFNFIHDMGAGGLSSSFGEMAQRVGGLEVDLARAPLKYAGLQPWEIWLSEAQERQSLSVPPDKIDELLALARERDVEATVLGRFNTSGYIHLKYADQHVGWIALEFLESGYPRLELKAEWQPPSFPSVQPPRGDLTDVLRRLLMRCNLASRESKCRQYDHEVKGRTVVKPLVGRRRDIPSDATIFLAEYDGREGIVLSHGFNAHYSDLDTAAMMASVIDEAVRRIVAVGGRLDRIAGLDNFCWPDPVESPSTPDGRYKLAQLVRANQALHDVCVAYGVPLISGKDSMKNDSTRGGRKISIPPSVLFSALGKIDDIGRAVTCDAKAAGDYVYLLGVTRAELGASELAWMLHDESGRDDPPAIGGRPPALAPAAALALYRAVERATRAGRVRSLHTPTLGGLAAGLARVAFGGELGLRVDLRQAPAEAELTDVELLFSETNSRFIATVAPDHAAAFEQALAGQPCARVGVVTDAPRLHVTGVAGAVVIDADVLDLKRDWRRVLAET